MWIYTANVNPGSTVQLHILGFGEASPKFSGSRSRRDPPLKGVVPRIRDRGMLIRDCSPDAHVVRSGSRSLVGGNKKQKGHCLRQLTFYFHSTLWKQAFNGFMKTKGQNYRSDLFAFVGMARFELATPRPPDEYSKPCWATSRYPLRSFIPDLIRDKA